MKLPSWQLHAMTAKPRIESAMPFSLRVLEYVFVLVLVVGFTLRRAPEINVRVVATRGILNTSVEHS
jgi:hypothetical protein